MISYSSVPALTAVATLLTTTPGSLLFSSMLTISTPSLSSVALLRSKTASLTGSEMISFTAISPEVQPSR